MDKKSNGGGNQFFFWHKLEQGVFINGVNLDRVKLNYTLFQSQINLNSFKSYWGIGIEGQHDLIRPQFDPDHATNNLDLKRFSSGSIELESHFVYNTKNDLFFAKEGAYFKLKISRSLQHEVKSKFTSSEDPPIGLTNNYLRIAAKYEKRIPLNKKTTSVLEFFSGFIIPEKRKEGELSYLGNF